MSHEIRTPMTAILGYADLLLEDGDISRAPEHRVELIETIRSNGDHLLSIINDILDLSKIEAGKFQLERIECSPHEVLVDVKELMMGRAIAKGIAWKVELDGPLPITISTDPTRLRQILINLVGNAMKFTEVGSVKLVARSINLGESQALSFDIIDTGIGMSREQTEQLFSPFQQADSSMSRKFGGTGLGLTISKRFAEMLGGDISVKSELGQGSTFRLTIDAGDVNGVVMCDRLEKPKAKTEVDGLSNSATDKLLADCRLLLVEDGPDNQRLISFVLSKAGADVVTAENGLIGRDLALEAADQGQPFDMILMDMQMPVMDGYTATRELRQQGYPGPVIALTAHAMAENRQECIDAGCDDFATKPIDRAKLISAIQEWLPTREPAIES